MTTEELIFWAVVIVLAIVVIRAIFPLIMAAVGLLLAGIVILFALDKRRGGTAINQLMDKLAGWVKARIGG